MIASFRSKALRNFWTKGDASGIGLDWRRKTLAILTRLDAIESPEQMDVPSFGFHALSGDLSGRYATAVSRNWRITFAWLNADAVDVDLEDYHGS